MSNHVLDQLFALIKARAAADEPQSSYTAKLLAGGAPLIARKVGEEAIELVIEAMNNDPEKLKQESADLLYHVMVLWAAMDIKPHDVYEILRQRMSISGLEEKRQRKTTDPEQ
jgi:phosphoribosyl-ATP pyrophosphohydrolase